MRSSMSIVGLYTYNPNLFQYFHFPFEGQPDAPYSKDEYVNKILIDAMDMELVYPDSDFMKKAINFWSLSMKDSWERMAAALLEKYNPIDNYNRTETWTDTDSRTENWTDTDSHTDSWTHGSGVTDTGTVDVKRTDNLKQKNVTKNDTDMTDTTEVDGEDINSSVAYNTNTWKNNTKTKTDNTTDRHVVTDNDVEQTTDNTGTQDTKTTNNLHHNIDENGLSTISGSVGRTGSTGGSITHTGNISGNIGVTTSQNMVEEEVQLRVKNQLMNIVTRQFIEYFCILVY